MGRPKSSARNAEARLEEAFWDMLSRMPYSDITVMALARQAGLNHNTIYYHFGGIDDMAAAFVGRTLSPETTERFIRMVAGTGTAEATGAADGASAPDGTDGTFDAGLFEGFRRVRLLAASESPYLRRLTRERMREAWLAHFGIAEADLTPEEQMDMRFAFAGIFDLLGDKGLSDLPQQLPSFMSRDIGSGIRKTIARIAAAPRLSRPR